MPPDVAGATFMAAGSSGPELATAVIGVFVAKVIFDLFILYLVIWSHIFHNLKKSLFTNLRQSYPKPVQNNRHI